MGTFQIVREHKYVCVCAKVCGGGRFACPAQSKKTESYLLRLLYANASEIIISIYAIRHMAQISIFANIYVTIAGAARHGAPCHIADTLTNYTVILQLNQTMASLLLKLFLWCRDAVSFAVRFVVCCLCELRKHKEINLNKCMPRIV